MPESAKSHSAETTESPPRSPWDTFVREPLHDIWNPPKDQIASLDALRSLAVMLVILMHFSVAYTNGLHGERSFYSNFVLVKDGHIGVDLFFILSGYFIGGQLWREVQRSKTVDIKKFILRRGFRIWPLYFAMLFLSILQKPELVYPGGRGWADALFVSNYFPLHGMVRGGWSLAVEEQFYILAPALVFFAASRIDSIRDCRKYVLALVVLSPVIRALIWMHEVPGGLSAHNPEVFEVMRNEFHTHADGLTLGLLISNIAVSGDESYRKGFFGSPWLVIVALGLAAILQKIHHDIFQFTSVSLVFGATTWFLITHRWRVLAFLETKPFFIISRLSFGMYLNHLWFSQPLAAWGMDHLPFRHEFPGLQNFAITMLGAVISAALALVTYCLIEHPFLMLRGRVMGKAKAAA